VVSLFRRSDSVHMAAAATFSGAAWRNALCMMAPWAGEEVRLRIAMTVKRNEGDVPDGRPNS
jgi:hypothetical protein